MLAFLLRSFLGPENIKSLVGKAVFAIGGALGYSAVMQHSDVQALASALFTAGSIIWSWYRAHQAEQAKAAVAVAARTIAAAPVPYKGTAAGEKAFTAALNNAQLKG